MTVQAPDRIEGPVNQLELVRQMGGSLAALGRAMVDGHVFDLQAELRTRNGSPQGPLIQYFEVDSAGRVPGAELRAATTVPNDETLVRFRERDHDRHVVDELFLRHGATRQLELVRRGRGETRITPGAFSALGALTRRLIETAERAPERAPWSLRNQTDPNKVWLNTEQLMPLVGRVLEVAGTALATPLMRDGRSRSLDVEVAVDLNTAGHLKTRRKRAQTIRLRATSPDNVTAEFVLPFRYLAQIASPQDVVDTAVVEPQLTIEDQNDGRHRVDVAIVGQRTGELRRSYASTAGRTAQPETITPDDIVAMAQFVVDLAIPRTV